MCNAPCRNLAALPATNPTPLPRFHPLAFRLAQRAMRHRDASSRWDRHPIMLSPSIFSAGSWILYIVHEGRPQQMPGTAWLRLGVVALSASVLAGWLVSRPLPG